MYVFNLLYERHTQFPCYDSIHNDNGMIKSCKWQGQFLPCSELFKSFPTDSGMCCSFNMKQANELFKDKQYQKLIKLMQTNDKKYALMKDNNVENWNNNPIPQEGQDKGLELILDAHRDIVSGGTVMEDFEGFFAIIDSNEQFPMVKRKSILIRPGHNNFVGMKATKVTANENIRSIITQKRNCLFHDEMRMNVHQNYSQSSCMFESKMEYTITKVIYINFLTK